jgi:hypothetical protein
VSGDFSISCLGSLLKIYNIVILLILPSLNMTTPSITPVLIRHHLQHPF